MITANSVISALAPANNTSFCQVTGNAFGFPDFGVNTYYNKMAEVIDSAMLVLVTSSGTPAGTIDIQSLTMQTPATAPTWIASGASPTNLPAQIFPWTVTASATLKIPLNIPNAAYCPALGLRVSSTGLVGVSVTFAQLIVTWR